MMPLIAAFISMLALTASPSGPQAAQNDKKAPTVAGTWTLAVRGPAAHGDITAALVLDQEGAEVTGTFSVHGMEHAVEGQFTDGALTLATTSAEGSHQLSFTGRLNADGTLAGHVSGPMGELQWTGTRGSAKSVPDR